MPATLVLADPGPQIEDAAPAPEVGPAPVFAGVGPPVREHLGVDEIAELAYWLASGRVVEETARARRMGTHRLLTYLAGFDGSGWQERWEASGLEAHAPVAWRDVVCAGLGLNASFARRSWIAAGLCSLMALDVVRPSLEFMLQGRWRWSDQLRWRQDPDAAVVNGAPGTAQSRSHATSLLARLVVLTGKPIRGLCAEDLLAYRQAVLACGGQTHGMECLWAALAAAGVLEGTFFEALRRGRPSVEQIVDRYEIASRPVRDLFVAYLAQRSVAVDFSTLVATARCLCDCFWKQVEAIAPGIDTIDLPAGVAARWTEQIRWRTDRDGNVVPRRDFINVCVAVRGFYLDLIQLAHEEPARWAPWACRSPLSEADVQGYRKWRQELRSRMHQRTRVRATHTVALADHAERRWLDAKEILDAARAVDSQQVFAAGGVSYERLDKASHPDAHPRVARLDVTDAPFDAVQAEEDTFWAFVIVEVLRHTGMRVEELIELTQLDLHEYRHRDPKVGIVLLLHVNPSKQDQERMLVVAPELAAVLACVVRRILTVSNSTDGSVPSVVAYDPLERTNSEPLPFLFQRTAGKSFKGGTRVIQRAYIGKVLRKLCRSASLTDAAGGSVDFTAHDFRRVFATDALAAGLPPHIIQKLMGHASLSTTQGYAAIFPEDVIRSHRAFIENRRRQRPADEYRPVADHEWVGFEEHFAKRKIAIGDCVRAYGTNCVHEYACEQCGLARPDLAARPRVERTRHGLVEQLAEANERGWHGEIERLNHIIAAVDDKLATIERSQRRTVALVASPGPRRADSNGH